MTIDDKTVSEFFAAYERAQAKLRDALNQLGNAEKEASAVLTKVANCVTNIENCEELVIEAREDLTKMHDLIEGV